MSTNNKVFQVLVATGNQALATVGTTLDALAVGQLGIFDVNTNLAVPATAVKKFYIAVGAPDGNVFFSAGQEIQKVNVRDFTYKPHTAARPMIFDIKDFNDVKCDTEYAIKFEFRNSQIYARQGYVQYSKTYGIKTECCVGNSDDASSIEVINKFLEAFNAAEEDLFSAKAVSSGAKLTVTDEVGAAATGNVTVTIGEDDIVVTLDNSETTTGVATKIASAINNDTTSFATASATGSTVTISNVNFDVAVSYVDTDTTGATATVVLEAQDVDMGSLVEGVIPSLRITSNPLAIQKYCDINLQYHNLRQTVIIPSLIEGFNCTGKVEVVQEAASEEGSGYDIKQKEYHAGGWNGKPGVYRASSALGLAMPGFDYMADASLKYDQFHLVYDQFSTAGWGEYLNNLMTIVAIPATSTVTRDAFATAMNVQLAPLGFETLVDDAAAADVDPTVVEPTPPASYDLDGIA